MENSSILALRDNVARLMVHHEDSQISAAKRGGLSQRAVGYVVTYGKTHSTAPTMRTIEGLSKAFGIPAWMLCIPDMPIELLTTSRLANLVENYLATPEDGRDSVDRIAKSEARYALTTGRSGKRDA